MNDSKPEDNEVTLNHLDGFDEQEPLQPEGNGSLFGEMRDEQDRFEPSIGEHDEVPFEIEPAADKMADELADDATQFEEPAQFDDDEAYEDSMEEERRGLPKSVIYAGVAVVALILVVMLASSGDDSNNKADAEAQMGENFAPSVPQKDYVQVLRKLDEKAVELEERRREVESLRREVESLRMRLEQAQRPARVAPAPSHTAAPTHAVAPAPTSMPAPITSADVTAPAAAKAPPAPAASGDWMVNILSTSSREAALTRQAQFTADGYATEISEVTINGKRWYRLGMTGLASEAEARERKALLAGKYGIKDAWVRKR